MSILKALALVAGVILIAAGLYLFWLFFALAYGNTENVGWRCPGGGCNPAPNSAGMEINYPHTIKLNTSEPIKIKTFVYELNPEKLGCPAPKIPATVLNYEANLRTSGLEISPSDTQKADNVIDMKTNNGTSAEWSWIIHPKETGTYTLHAEITSKIENCPVAKLDETFQIQVVNIFGLTAKHLAIISLIFSIGSFLGGLKAVWTGYKEIKAWFKGKDKKKRKKKPQNKNSKQQEE